MATVLVTLLMSGNHRLLEEQPFYRDAIIGKLHMPAGHDLFQFRTNSNGPSMPPDPAIVTQTILCSDWLLHEPTTACREYTVARTIMFVILFVIRGMQWFAHTIPSTQWLAANAITVQWRIQGGSKGALDPPSKNFK